MYSKLPPEDEQFIYSKHVEDIIGINLERKNASGWYLLRRLIMMHGTYNVKRFISLHQETISETLKKKSFKLARIRVI